MVFDEVIFDEVIFDEVSVSSLFDDTPPLKEVR